MSEARPAEYTYLKLPPVPHARPCVGLVLAGMAVRARVGVGGLDEAVDLLEGFHSGDEPTRYRFFAGEEGIVAEVEDKGAGRSGEAEEPVWRTVVELVS